MWGSPEIETVLNPRKLIENYPVYSFLDEDVREGIASFARLDFPKSHPFDEFHAHKYHQCIGFLNGGGEHILNFKKQGICSNSFHFLPAGELHLLERGMKSSGFVISVKKQFIQKLEYINPDVPFSNLFSQSRIFNLNANETADFDPIIGEMLANETNDRYLLNLIGTFFTKIALVFEPSRPVSNRVYDPMIVDLMEFINLHYKKQFSVAQYAELVHTAPANLQKKVKNITGKSVRELQQERLLKEAQKLLCRPDHNISEIADELGFKELAHFSNWFKKLVGETPSEYKD